MRSIAILLVFLFFLAGQGFSQRACATEEYIRGLGNIVPELRIKRTASTNLSGDSFPAGVASGETPSTRTMPQGTISSGVPSSSVIVIPVVVHVLYNKEEQNISAAQIKAQIDILNKDYRRQNADAQLTPEAFKDLAADVHIEFRLASEDPNGLPTSGIVRKKTAIEFFGIDDRIKSSGMGGDNAWDPDKYLNIWTGNLAGGVLGYASLLGGPAEKDGVAIRYNVFGNTGGAFGKGRTATHEIGHWLGLRHIWGDRDCGDDGIADTPPQAAPSRGCPSGVQPSCDNAPAGSMYMNFMDFTNDECTNMFTLGQAQKMRSLFNEGGLRHALASSTKANGTPLEDAIDMTASSPEEIKLFPNPSIGTLTIRFNADPPQGDIVIYNHVGQTVKRLRITESIMRINTTALANGVYYIKAGDTGRAYKFIMAR